MFRPNGKHLQRTLSIMGLLALCALQVACSADPCKVKCTPGAQICDDISDGLATCAIDPQLQCLSWVVSTCPGKDNRCIEQDGKAFCSKDGGTDKCKEACTVGQTQCAANAVVTCEPGAPGQCPVWGAPQVCPEKQVCVNGKCSTPTCQDTCTDGQTRCAANTIEQCTRSSEGCLAWSTQTTCQTGEICQNDQCTTSCQQVCTEGETRCSGTSVQTCSKDAATQCTIWDKGQDCEKGQSCEQGACKGDACKDECSTGATQCDANGKVQSCTADAKGCGVWDAGQDCPTGQTCTDGACKGGTCNDTCTDGATRCDASGKLETCTKDAQGCLKWGTATACPSDQACQNNACTPTTCKNQCNAGEGRCDSGGRLQTCGANAQGCLVWKAGQACPTGQTCSDGACKSGTCNDACTDGATQCDANGKLQTCTKDAQGCLKWGTAAACPSGQTCQNNQCTPPTCNNACTAGATRCDANGKLQTCAKDAQGCLKWGTAAACPSGQTCQNNKCQAACSHKCTAGATRCDANGKLQTCTTNAQGCRVWGTAAACPSGQSCQNNKCQTACSHKCAASATRCDANGKLQTCTTDAQGCRVWGTAAACPSGQTCQNNNCQAAGCANTCTTGQKRCYGNSIQTCQLDTNNCPEWASGSACATGKVCDEGACVTHDFMARTQQQVCARWKRDYAYTTQPNFQNDGTQCDPGKIAQGAIDDAMRRASLYRWLVGLPPVVEDPALSQLNQFCAILQANNDGPGNGVNAHSPPSTWDCYTDKGKQGSGSSNLSWGVSHPADTISQYISDYRVSSLGHRLWCISPGWGKTGLGLARGTGRYRVASCLYTFARTAAPSVDFIAYPPPGWVPIQAVNNSRHPVKDWSFTSSKYKVSTLTEVTLVRQSDNDTQKIKPRRIGSYGHPSGLAFVPRTPVAGETYTVKLGTIYSYTVKFFDCK